MTIRKERSALGFALLTLITGCARSAVVEGESADYSADVYQVADASVSSTDSDEAGDAGTARADATERPRVASPDGADASSAAQAKDGVQGQLADASVAPVANAAPVSAVAPVGDIGPIAAVAATDAGTYESDVTRVAPTPAAPVVAPSSPSTSVRDAAIPAQPSTPLDAGASPAQPADPSPSADAPDAGASKPSAPVDVSSSAGSAASCVAGRYVGAFHGQISQPQLGSLVLSGTVTLQLTLSADGRTLEVQSGAVDAADAAGTPIHADIDGTVDCATKQVNNGTLRGYYGSQQTSSNTFQGTVTGSYGPSSPSVQGTWTVPLSGASATGTYETAKQD